MECPPAVRYLAPRINIRSVFLYSHSTNSIIWDCIFYVSTGKMFAILLMFHLLFLAVHFLSIKIVSQTAGKCNYIPPPQIYFLPSYFLD